MERAKQWAATVLVTSLVVSTLGAGLAVPGTAAGTPTDANMTSADVAPVPDPESDTVGWENGYWYNESVDVNQRDGLTQRELQRWTSQAQAQVEYITGQEFTENVTVQLLTPEEAENQSAGLQAWVELLNDERYRIWSEQVEEAQFVQGENESIYGEENLTVPLFLTGVYGYYESYEDELVVLRNKTRPVAVDNATLVHELTHALQDQIYNLSDPKYNGETLDEYTAELAIQEGQAAYVEHRYLEACGPDGPFECVRSPRAVFAPPAVAYGGLPPNITGVQPYTDGAAWVRQLYDQGGLAAVDAVFQNPPNTTEQTVHTERYPSESAEPMTVEDTARGGWETFAVDTTAPNGTEVLPLPLGENGTERIGELGVFELFARQSVVYGVDVIDLSGYDDPDDGPYDVYNYTSKPSEGWANDRLVPYERTGSNGTEYGYVWKTAWDTRLDAVEFHAAYRKLLRGHNATRVADDTYVVRDGPFADAFRVSLRGSTVTIVNAPTVADLSDVRPTSNVSANGSASAE